MVAGTRGGPIFPTDYDDLDCSAASDSEQRLFFEVLLHRKMALSYFPGAARVGSPQPTVEGTPKLSEAVQEAYIEHKDR